MGPGRTSRAWYFHSPVLCYVAVFSLFQHLKQSCIFGAIVGGYNERERLRCVKETINKPVDGEQIGT